MIDKTHAYFNEGIYKWAMEMEFDKYLSTEKIKMDREEFINCIRYLNDNGIGFQFSGDMSKVKRIQTLAEFDKEMNAIEANRYHMRKITTVRDTIYSRRVKDLAKGIDYLRTPENASFLTIIER